MRRKTKVWLATGLLALTVVGCTWAYFTSTSHIDNRLSTKAYGNTITEKFTPRDDWQPGQKVEKVFAVKNTGDSTLVVRVKMDESWAKGGTPPFKTLSSTATDSAEQKKIFNVHQGDKTDGLVAADATVVDKEINTANWVFYEGYWYYKSLLTAGNETPALLNSITLDKDADMGKYTVTSYYHEGTAAPTFEPGDAGDNHTPKGGWKEFTGAVPEPTAAGNMIFIRTVSKLDSTATGYAGADYTLTITAETCQATLDAVKTEWSLATLPPSFDWVLK